MADFGLYSALSQPRRNWAQVRQDRMMELGMLQSMQQDLQQRIQAESQARAGVVEYMNQLQQVSVLEGDYEKITALEKSERQKIVEGIQKAGNNVQKFLNGDGIAILNTYRNNIMQSDEMRNAIGNKLAFAQAGLDKYMGRIARPVYDEQGNRITFEQQMEQFQNGERERLEYGGSVEPVDMTKIRAIVQSTYGKDRYKRQAAGADDIYNIARELGAEDWMAEDIRDGYMAGVEAGAEPLYFNQDTFKDEMNYRIALSRKLSKADETGNSNMWQEYLDGKYYKMIRDKETGELVPAVRMKSHKDGSGKKVGQIFSGINKNVYERMLNHGALSTSEDGEGIYYDGGYGDAKVYSNDNPIDITGYTFTPEDIVDYVTEYEIDEKDMQPVGKNYYIRVKIDLPEKQERQGDVNEGDDFFDTPFFSDLLGNPNKYDNRKTDVLIPVDPRAFSVAQGSFSARDELKYNQQIGSDINLLEGILTEPY